jgi:hypothetical protein
MGGSATGRTPALEPPLAQDTADIAPPVSDNVPIMRRVKRRPFLRNLVISTFSP